LFTGLVSSVGTIDRVRSTGAGREFRIRCDYRDLAAGESIALNGACLTVREFGDGWFTVAAVVTTLDRTTIAGWAEGSRVNLERALAVGDRLGGHFVQGHVDGVAEVTAVSTCEDARLVDLSLPAELMPLMVPHGSITVDGVSLTVNALPNEHTAQLSLIAFTLDHTTLGALKAGDRVHIEADVIAKHVERLMSVHLI
jgi:riboflavin synthase